MNNIINTIRSKFQKQQKQQVPAESLAMRTLQAYNEEAIKGTLTHEVLDAVAISMADFIAESRLDGFRSIMLQAGCAECLCAENLRRVGAACMQCHTYAEPVTRSEKRTFALGERLLELASKKEFMTPVEQEEFEQHAREELVVLRYRAEQRAAKLAEQTEQAERAEEA